MSKKISSTVLVLVMLSGINLQVMFAQTANDWSKVTSIVNKEIAVKPLNGKTIFGKLISANETEIVLQKADNKQLTSESMTISKNDIKKVWTAKFAFKKNMALTTSIGAGIGAAIGAGAGFGLLGATGGSDEGGQILAATTAIGAGLGAVTGFFIGKNGHRKLDLIYQNK